MVTTTPIHIGVPCVVTAGSADALTLIEWVGSALVCKMLDAIDLPNDSKLFAAAAACKYTSGATVLDGSVIFPLQELLPRGFVFEAVSECDARSNRSSAVYRATQIVTVC